MHRQPAEIQQFALLLGQARVAGDVGHEQENAPVKHELVEGAVQVGVGEPLVTGDAAGPGTQPVMNRPYRGGEPLLVDHHGAVLGGRETGAASLREQVDQPVVPERRVADSAERRRPRVELLGKPPEFLRRQQELVDVGRRCRAREHHHRQIEGER